ncbi:putative cation-transporting ATPase 13A4, partial [Discoglossus pictus]
TIGYLLSLGFLRILFYWKPEFDVWCHCVPCRLKEADVILLRTTDALKQYSKKKLITIHPKVQGTNLGHQVITDENSIISKSIMKPECKVRYIQVQKVRYVWNISEGKFQKIGILDEEFSCSDIHSEFGRGLSREEREFRQQICGPNSIEVKIIPIRTLLFKEVFNFFYAFQVFAMAIKISTGYSEYTIAIIILVVISVTVTIYHLRVQSIKLHNMAASYNSIKVTVLHKNGDFEQTESQCLVPGDVIILSGKKLYLPCDAILISGGCTVNESMLTGESIPVTKTALPHYDYSAPWKTQCGDDYKKHVLFCGTEIIQTKAYSQNLVKAVVLKTGFNTEKGDLVRAILYDKPINVKLHRDAMRFLSILFGIAVFAASFTAYSYTMNGASLRETVLMSLLMLTLAVESSIPASLTLALVYAQARLKKQGIFCISPQKINVAGLLNLICFDKTGTMTEDIFDLWGVAGNDGNCFQEVHHFSSGNIMPWSPMLGAMASCHSLIILDGKMHGDPLDLKMFEGTGWELTDYKTSSNKDGKSLSCTMVRPGARSGKVPVQGIAILHQFPFSSSMQRMSVITQAIGEDDLTLFMKGAPETVISFCKPETVPDNFSKRLDFYSTQGFRVIGLAYRVLDKANLSNIEQYEREELESDLIFLGLLIMENRLKPETKAVLHELTLANIRNVMVTGDNLQTAVTVGKNSGMIPNGSKLILIEATKPEGDSAASITWKTITDKQENKQVTHDLCIASDSGGFYSHIVQGEYRFVISGDSFKVILLHFYNLLPNILLNGIIFARMTPRQKADLCEEFKKLDYYVGMCGDGANDCGALKTAHVGISLSELEASVASPFTSKIPNIECVPKLVKEGRNSLVTAYSLFKLIMTTILISVPCELLLFSRQTILGNYQFLLQDMSISIPSFITFSLNGPAPQLVPYRPPGQLQSPPLLLSVILQIILSITMQVTAFVLVQQQPWYSKTDVFSACLSLNQSTGNYTLSEPAFSENYLTTNMWFTMGVNLIIIEFVFAKGRPFRQRLYTNYLLSLLILLQVVTYLFLHFADIERLYTAMEFVCTPYYWRMNTFIMAIVLFVVSYTVEEGFIENRKLWLWIKRISNYQSKSQYRKLQKRLENDPNWPPLNRTDYAAQSISVMDTKVDVSSELISNQNKSSYMKRQEYDYK